MSKAQEYNGKKCAFGGDRTFNLGGDKATKTECTSKCAGDPDCVAFSGIWNSFCIGCKSELDTPHPGTLAFIKDGN